MSTTGTTSGSHRSSLRESDTMRPRQEERMLRNNLSTLIAETLHERLEIRHNPSEDDFYNSPIIRERLPFPPTVQHSNITEWDEEDQRMAAIFTRNQPITQRISLVKLDPHRNTLRREYRRLARVLYGYTLPTANISRYPSPPVEEWGVDLFEMLDNLLTFKPNILATNRGVATVCMDDVQEFGQFYTYLLGLNHSAIDAHSEDEIPFQVHQPPQWPLSDHFLMKRRLK